MVIKKNGRLLCLLIVILILTGIGCRAVQELEVQPGATGSPPVTTTPIRVDCSNLGSTWAGGTAVQGQDGIGYDVSGCVRQSNYSRAEIVKPAERDVAQWSEARCNDGTPFGFWVQLSPEGIDRDWVIYLRGGGFCDDRSTSCAQRSKHLTTSLTEPDGSLIGFQGAGLFHRNPEKNPTFYADNYVIAQYCSSDAWSGSTIKLRPTTANPEGWYFSGRENVKAMLEILTQRYGLDDADEKTRILFAGSSAGGIGVETNADIAAERFPQIARDGRLKLVNDGGYIVDFDDPLHRPGNSDLSVRDLVAANYEFWGSSHNPLCETAQRTNGEEPGLCFLGAVNYPYLTQSEPQGLGLPVLVQLSTLDSSALQLHGLMNLNDPQIQPAIENWRTSALRDLKQVNWLFSGGTHAYHTVLLDTQAIQMGPGENTFYKLLTLFWEGGAPVRLIFGNP